MDPFDSDSMKLIGSMKDGKGVPLSAPHVISLLQFFHCSPSRPGARIAKLLLESELVYAGQGYCVALGLIGGKSCQDHLREYLKKYLPIRGRYYDQHWAIGALAHIQGAPPEEFLDSTLWEEINTSNLPLPAIQRFDRLINYLQQHRMIA